MKRTKFTLDKVHKISLSRGHFWCDWYRDGQARSKCKELIKRGLMRELFRNKHGVYYEPVRPGGGA
jgi:hypothetical protein